MGKPKDPEVAARREAYQRTVNNTNKDLGIAMGIGHITLLIITIIYWLFAEDLGIKMPRLATHLDRIVYALKLETLALIPLYLALLHVMVCRVRHAPARNPLSGHEHAVEKPARILANTVEQTLFHLPNFFAFCCLVPGSHLYLAPFLIFLFFVGRIVFHIGYMVHAKHRGYGFIWTFIPTTVVLIYNVFRVFFG